MSKRVADALRRVKARLSLPGAWGKRLYARDAAGGSCAPRSERAVSWCLVGAMRKEKAHQHAVVDAIIRAKAIAAPTFHGDVTVFNDDPLVTHRHILGLLDWAIALEERDTIKLLREHLRMLEGQTN